MDSLKHSNSALQSKHSQCQRDLQSCEQKCSSLGKLLGNKDKEHRDAIQGLLSKAADAEHNLEKSTLTERDLRSQLALHKEKIASLEIIAKDNESHNKDQQTQMQHQIASAREKNNALASRIPQLEDDAATIKEACAKEIQKAQQEAEHLVREATLKADALVAIVENEKLKSKRSEEELKKQTTLDQAAFRELAAEKENAAKKLGKVVAEEREVSRCLLGKVQEQSAIIQTLTEDKLLLNQHATKHSEKIYMLELVVERGEAKLRSMANQLARSLQEQERRISVEAELKKELRLAKTGL